MFLMEDSTIDYTSLWLKPSIAFNSSLFSDLVSSMMLFSAYITTTFSCIGS